MKFVPNQTKVCRYCGRVILYGETYEATERLDENNDVVLTCYHIDCKMGSIPGYGGSMAASGISIPSRTTWFPWSSTGNYGIIGQSNTIGQPYVDDTISWSSRNTQSLDDIKNKLEKMIKEANEKET